MGIIMDQWNNLKPLSSEDLFQLTQKESSDLEITGEYEDSIEIQVKYVLPHQVFWLRTDHEINWDQFIWTPEGSVVDKVRVGELLDSMSPALLMSVPKIVFVENETMMLNWHTTIGEEAENEWIMDFYDQFVFVNIEWCKEAIEGTNISLNDEIVHTLLSKLVHQHQRNPIYFRLLHEVTAHEASEAAVYCAEVIDAFHPTILK